MALWQYLLLLGLIAGTVAATYLAFRRWQSLQSAGGPDSDSDVARSPDAAQLPDAARSPDAAQLPDAARSPDAAELRPAADRSHPRTRRHPLRRRMSDVLRAMVTSEVHGDERAANERLRAHSGRLVDYRFSVSESTRRITVSWHAGPTLSSPLDRLADRVRDFAAHQVFRVRRDTVTLDWSVIDVLGVEGLAAAAARADRSVQEFLGERLAVQLEAGGMPVDLAGGTGYLASWLIPPPGDRQLGRLLKHVRIAGLVFGLATRHPAVALACVKSLVRGHAVTLLGLLLDHATHAATPDPAGPGGSAQPARRDHRSTPDPRTALGGAGSGSSDPGRAGNAMAPPGSGRRPSGFPPRPADPPVTPVPSGPPPAGGVATQPDRGEAAAAPDSPAGAGPPTGGRGSSRDDPGRGG